jgi:hypothetical protein
MMECICGSVARISKISFWHFIKKQKAQIWKTLIPCFKPHNCKTQIDAHVQPCLQNVQVFFFFVGAKFA